MNVGVVAACPYPVPQGSQVYVEQTVRALQLAGRRGQLACYAHGAGEAPGDIEVIRCKPMPGYTRTQAGPSIEKLVLDAQLAHTVRLAAKEHQWKAVVAHNYEGLLVAMAARPLPIIYAAHNAMADELPHYFGGARWARWLGQWLDGALPRRANVVLAPHAVLAEYLVGCGCARERMVLSAPCAPVDDFDGAPPAEDAPFVLYSGNFDAYQNLPLLLAAMERVHAAMPAAPFLAVTHAAGEIPLATMVRATGFESTAELLRRDAIFAAPRVSWSGYPVKLLNALAAGRPVVACASAAGPIAHGVHGLLVQDDDAQGFADALLTLLRDRELRLRLGANGRRLALEQHTPAHMAARLDQALGMAVDSRR